MLIRSWLRVVFAAVLAALVGSAAAAQSAGGGTLTGRVVDEGGAAVPGALISVAGSARQAVSALDGSFLLPGLPVGEQVVDVSALGFGPEQLTLTLGPGQMVTQRIVLKPAPEFGDALTVSGQPILVGQAKALNQQMSALNIVNIVSADQIGSFPDPNATEATQRIPGISIQRDQGEGRYVLIRGTEARLNSMMLDGERLPSPEGDIRNVALDVLPADLLEAIEVSKALTADMDADAIGGVVNLVTRKAGEEPLLGVALNAGYNDISDDTAYGGGFSFGRRFSDGKVGLVLGGSYLTTDRGSENFEVAYDDGDLDELEQRDYTINRERAGLAATFDARPSPTAEFVLRGMFNEFDDMEYRQRVRNQVGDDRMERELKDRFESQQIYQLQGSGSRVLGNGGTFSYRLSYAYAEEDEPDARYTTFRQEEVTFDPNVDADTIDPDSIQANPQNEDLAEYKFEDLAIENNLTTEEDLVASAELAVPLGGRGGTASLLRVGAKYRDKSKDRDANSVVYEAEDDVFMTEFIGSDVNTILDGRYTMGPFVPPSVSDRLLRDYALESEVDPEADLADYDAAEDTVAAFALVEMYVGDRWTLVPGVRWEQTQIDYTGYELLFNEDGDYESTTARRGESDYSEVLPSVHLKYQLDDRTNLRAAVTRTMSRPNYYDLVPYQLVLEEDLEIERGNPALTPTLAWNADLMFERFFPSVGLVSAGIFYKDLSDYIYYYRVDEDRDGDTYEATEPRNGESATLWGVELAYQKRFVNLPRPFDGLGLYANYTYTDSEAVYPEREGSKATLPGQSENVGNLAVSYESGRFSGQISLNYHGKYVDAVGSDAAGDVYYDDHLQLDLTMSMLLGRGLRLSVDLLNLTDEPLRYYEGTSDRPIQEEYYSWWGTVGLRWTL